MRGERAHADHFERRVRCQHAFCVPGLPHRRRRDIRHHTQVGIEVAVEDQRAKRRFRVAGWWRNALDDCFEDLLDAYPRFADARIASVASIWSTSSISSATRPGRGG